jgi:hypothetical protein
MRINQSVMTRTGVAALLGLAGLITAGCKDLTNQPLPAGTFDPTSVNNAPGARGMAITAKAQFQFGLATYIPIAGLLTDEFQANARGTTLPNGNFPEQYVAVDARVLPQGAPGALATDMLYAMLQQQRMVDDQAIGALLKYDADSSAGIRSELYAQKGYAVLWLADLFCSGVPLSTSDFQQDFTYKPSSSTDALYQHALALFDTAMTLAADSNASVTGLATVGKARVQLALGQYDAAAQTVSSIPIDFQYTQPIRTCNSTAVTGCSSQTQAYLRLAYIGTMADNEGGVGLPYLSGHDLRSAPRPTSIGTVNGNAVWFPNKLPFGSVANLMVASGIEAELIRAEADLKAGGSTWLTRLNTLRTTGVYTGVDTTFRYDTTITYDTTQVGGVEQVDTTTTVDTVLVWADTAWVAGTGGVGHLGPLQDPGTADGRVDLLFRERAFWLYATGTRQGDLRRLVRQYHRDKNTLYPRGAYPGVGDYGDYIDAPIPMSGSYSESPNPYFHGCLSRD